MKTFEELKKAEPKKGVAYNVASNRASYNLETGQDEHLKPREVDWAKLKLSGVESIPGINITKEKRLLFK